MLGRQAVTIERFVSAADQSPTPTRESSRYQSQYLRYKEEVHKESRAIRGSRRRCTRGQCRGQERIRTGWVKFSILRFHDELL